MPQPVPRYEAFTPSSETASRIKKRNKRKDTKSEVVLRKLVWRLGLRYRLHRNDLPGKPDLVFAGDHVAVFCDGDFWHGRNWDDRKKKLRKGANPAYWIPKIEANIARDKEQTKALTRSGWKVVRLWETDILKDPPRAAEKVRSVVYKIRKSRESA